MTIARTQFCVVSQSGMPSSLRRESAARKAAADIRPLFAMLPHITRGCSSASTHSRALLGSFTALTVSPPTPGQTPSLTKQTRAWSRERAPSH